MKTIATKTNVKTYKANEWRGHDSEFFRDLKAAPIGTVVKEHDPDGEQECVRLFEKVSDSTFDCFEICDVYYGTWAVGHVDKFFFDHVEDWCMENDVDFDGYVVNIEFLYPAA